MVYDVAEVAEYEIAGVVAVTTAIAATTAFGRQITGAVSIPFMVGSTMLYLNAAWSPSITTAAAAVNLSASATVSRTAAAVVSRTASATINRTIERVM